MKGQYTNAVKAIHQALSAIRADIKELNQRVSSLAVSPEKILQAAEQCPTAAATLKVLFPDVFTPPWKPGDVFEIGNSHYYLIIFFTAGDNIGYNAVNTEDGNTLFPRSWATIHFLIKSLQETYPKFKKVKIR